jgi:hypothetical protein
MLVLSLFHASGGFSRPSCLDRFACDSRTTRSRQRSRSRLTAFGRAQFAQGQRMRVAGIWCLGGWRGLACRFLNDLISQLIHVARALTCSCRHAPIVAHVGASFSGATI